MLPPMKSFIEKTYEWKSGILNDDADAILSPIVDTVCAWHI